MDWTILWWVLAALIVISGLVGVVVPALPGIPIMFAGLVLAAWSTDFEPVGWGTIGVLAALTVLSVIIDFLSAAFGAKRKGASPRAFLGGNPGCDRWNVLWLGRYRAGAIYRCRCSRNGIRQWCAPGRALGLWCLDRACVGHSCKNGNRLSDAGDILHQVYDWLANPVFSRRCAFIFARTWHESNLVLDL